MKYALITGASGGIGSAIATQLAADGYSLYLHYNNGREAVLHLCEALAVFEVELIPVQADLAANNGAEHLWENVTHELHAVIYTAGKSIFGLVTDIEAHQIEEITCLHVTSLYKLVNFALSSMIRMRQGNIVVVSSIWGQIGASCEVLYSMMKGAQNTYVKALAKEVAPSGVRVNAIAPGAVKTEMLSMFSEEDKHSIAADIPLGRLGEAEEIANVASFLLSKNSSYITGQVLGVNGGWHC